MIAVLVSLVSCSREGDGEESSDAVFYTVTFNSNGGSQIEPRQVIAGGAVSEPAEPVRDGFIFDGWYRGTQKWDFEHKKVEGDVTLDARWTDAETVFEHQPIDSQTTKITKLKKRSDNIRVPSVIGGYEVVAIGERVFADLSFGEIESITVSASVRSIGEEAFDNCEGIEVVIEGQLTHIGESAFLDCNGLSAVSFGEGLQVIPAQAFSGCSALKSVRIPSTVSVIEENAFDRCSSLATAMLYAHISSIEDSAFNGTALKTVYFYGTDDAVEALIDGGAVADKNEKLIDAKILIYSRSAPTGETVYDGYWYLDENNKTREWK